ncbi:MAG TPA: SusC/RagA family TonB-linked outer membrane protein [Gemmatimonadaceae bacterium]
MTRGVVAVVTLLLATSGALQAQATTGTIRGRVVEAGTNRPVGDAQVLVEGTSSRSMTNTAGEFAIVGVQPGSRAVTARRIGFTPVTQQVVVVAGQAVTLTLSLNQAASALDAVVVTALGEQAQRRTLGTSQQSVLGSAIAETQRENFVNSLQGRVAGVEVNSSSGVPGASTQITIRGVSSISSSNQPLFIIDGMPMDNKTLNSGVLASSFGGSQVSFENRGVDFTNRAADINSEDIESITILKGPEAAALYGIDAANGAVVITTKRGTSGGGLEYNNAFRAEAVRARPELQRTFGPTDPENITTSYWGEPYAPGTTFYDNVDGFFRTAFTQRHNLVFSGAAPDNKVNYRITGGLSKNNGVVPNTHYDRYNVTGAGQAQVTSWLNADLSTQYSYSDNLQSFKGAGGPLIGLLVWPQTDNAADWLTPAGLRRRVTSLSATGEIDNPYFNVNKNQIAATNSRMILNLGLRFTPFTWGNFKLNLGSDSYTTHNQILRHPESAYGYTDNGLIDVADDNTRNLSAQGLFNVNRVELPGGFGITALVGSAVRDDKSAVDALWGRDFLEPNFVSVNNASVRTSKTTIAQRRLMGVFGQATVDYRDYLYVTMTGRNDWTSTIPRVRNSFFYPGISASFVFTDAFPGTKSLFSTGKLRAAYAEVGKDASPYAYRPSLEYKTTSYGGYGYGFWGPNVNLAPEFAHSYEIGTELGILQDRLTLDATIYRKETEDQIVNNIRGSYATGFILFNLNGASTRAEGLELVLNAAAVRRNNFTWTVTANFDKSRAKVLALPFELPESYNSDTWLYGNIRNGTAPGLSTRSITGTFYMRNNKGELLIDPTSGLPVRNSTFVDAGYDRQPAWTMGLTNSFTYGKVRLSMLWDIRRGGDIMNATEHYLTTRGLSTRTLDRETPRVISGVLRDGLENTDHPTRNSIVITPASAPGYYTAMSEELFIEKDINWLRLRDITLNYTLPERFGRTSLFVTGTDLLLFTNYSGLDPIVNGNTAAVGGSGAVGIDFGNFPIPRGLNFGVKTAF